MGVHQLDEIVYSAHRSAIESDHASTYVIELEKVLDRRNDEGVLSDIMHLYQKNKEQVIFRENVGEPYFRNAVFSSRASLLTMIGTLAGLMFFNKELDPWQVEFFIAGFVTSLVLSNRGYSNLNQAMQDFKETCDAVNLVLYDKKDVTDSLCRQKELLSKEIKEYRDNLS